MERTSDVGRPRARRGTSRTAAWVLLALLAGGAGAAHAATISARVRWLPSASSGVDGYRVYQRTLAGSYGTPYDAGLPQPAADGTLAYTVNGLDSAVTYVFMVTARGSSGSESAPSNEMTLAPTTTTTTTSTTTSTTRPPTTTSTTTSSTSTTSTSTTTAPRPAAVPQSGWALVFVDSQELVAENGAAVNGFDGDAATIWHTKWSPTSAPLPHEIQIDLGATYAVSGFRYLPRPIGQNGRIKAWEFYVAATPGSWGTPVATGTFANSGSEKEIVFSAVNGRYVRLRALSEVNGNPWTSMAELNVLGTLVAPATTTTTRPTTTTTTTLAGSGLLPAPDWTAAFRAVFDLDEASGTRRNASAATCGTSCDLDDFGGVGRYTAGNPDGAGAADFTRATPTSLGKWLTSSSGFAVSGSLSIGCWARPTASGATAYMMARENGVNAGYRLSRTSSGRYGFLIGDGSDRASCRVGSSGQFAQDQWQHVAGVFDDAGELGGGIDRMYVFADGSQVGSTCTQQGLASTDWRFSLGHDDSSYAWQGQLDECFVRAGTLTAAQACRIKSCGIDGKRCLCSGSSYAPCTSSASCGGEGICDPTSNTCRGRNGGSCVLPACNAAAPAAGTARLAAAAAGCERELDAARLVLRVAGGHRRLRASGSFVAGADLDPTATGATVRVTSEDGALLYEAELPGTAFRQRPGRGGMVTWTARRLAVPTGTIGLERLDLAVVRGRARVALKAIAPDRVWTATAGRLDVSVRLGGECALAARLDCSARSRVTACGRR